MLSKINPIAAAIAFAAIIAGGCALAITKHLDAASGVTLFVVGLITALTPVLKGEAPDASK
jgi:hypothetical protein